MASWRICTPNLSINSSSCSMMVLSSMLGVSLKN
jgi:hypothetical protein